MLEMILGSMLLFTQLTGIGSGLPQVLTPAFKTATPVSAGSSGTSTFCTDQTNKVGKDVSGATVAGAATGCDFTAFIPM